MVSFCKTRKTWYWYIRYIDCKDIRVSISALVFQYVSANILSLTKVRYPGAFTHEHLSCSLGNIAILHAQSMSLVAVNGVPCLSNMPVCHYLKKSPAGGHLNIKMLSYQSKDSHHKGKMVSQLSYLNNGSLHTRKDGLYVEMEPRLLLPWSGASFIYWYSLAK